MKELAMKTKLIVRPIVGCLTHFHFWEGPCSAGHREDMTQKAEAKAAFVLSRNKIKLNKFLYFFILYGVFFPINYVTLIRVRSST